MQKTSAARFAAFNLLAGVVACGAASCARAQTTAPPGAKTKPAAAKAFVWWEAETPSDTNFPAVDKNPFGPANDTEAGVLSGKKWIGASGKRDAPLFLEYKVTVPESGRYRFFARKFWKHGPYRWRMDNKGDWQNVTKNVALLDDASLRQFTGANWTEAGEITLAPGVHTVRIESTENDGAIAFDAFLLTQSAFVARGPLKPGEKYDRTEPGWFAWEPDADPFAPSAIDLRSLNEKFAGENGFIGSKNGALVHGKTGKPVRFWAVNGGRDIAGMGKGAIDDLARTLAKYGVNMVRVHGAPWDETDWTKTDLAYVDQLQYFVAAMKREGIYTSLSIYFPLWLPSDKLAAFGYPQGKHPFALLFFNPEFQAAYRGWWRTLLTTPNPHANGVAFKDDPAVAVAELVNEDSYLFWTFTPYENVPAKQMEVLEKAFGAWAAKKYGSVPATLAKWGGATARGDDAATGRIGFVPLYEVFSKKDARAQDTARFLTEHQKAFFDQTTAFLQKDLGFKGVVYGSNWITADARVLGPLDKWSNTGGGMGAMDRHGYFGGPHEGERASYSLSVGDKYADRSALTFSPLKTGGDADYALPIFDIQYNNLPSLLTEVNWPMPNRYRADFPVITAAYGALQGSDALYFFALAGPGWQQTHGKFDLQTPVVMGQFPAAALIYRKGLIQTAPPVVSATLAMSDLWALKGAPVTAPVNLDEFRAKDIPQGKMAEVGGDKATIDPLAPLVGRVTVQFAETGATRVQTADLSKYLDPVKKTARSATGQLAWNWNDGRVALSAPQAQGATGYLSRGGRMALPDVTIETPLEYGSIVVVALDNKPIKTSARMLLQVATEDKNYGWLTRAVPTGEYPQLQEITNLGTAPILVKNVAGVVSLTRGDAGALRVTPLDANGYPMKGAKSVGDGKRITLLPNALYYLIEK